MPGPGNHDELAALLASFAEEVLPFSAGIRRGITSIFAVQADHQAVAAAHRSLDMIAAAATLFDLPAAADLSELARLVDQAVGAAERGTAPDEARAPLLNMVNVLEAQLNGILTGDDRGEERLEDGRRLLDQVLELVTRPEAAPELPGFSINLDDLLLTLAPDRPAPTAKDQPAEPAQPEPPVGEPLPTEPSPGAAAPEPDQGLVQSAEKEAYLLEQRGWDESGATYGRTDWLFVDTDELEAANAAANAATTTGAASDAAPSAPAGEAEQPPAEVAGLAGVHEDSEIHDASEAEDTVVSVAPALPVAEESWTAMLAAAEAATPDGEEDDEPITAELPGARAATGSHPDDGLTAQVAEAPGEGDAPAAEAPHADAGEPVEWQTEGWGGEDAAQEPFHPATDESAGDLSDWQEIYDYAAEPAAEAAGGTVFADDIVLGLAPAANVEAAAPAEALPGADDSPAGEPTPVEQPAPDPASEGVGRDLLVLADDQATQDDDTVAADQREAERTERALQAEQAESPDAGAEEAAAGTGDGAEQVVAVGDLVLVEKPDLVAGPGTGQLWSSALAGLPDPYATGEGRDEPLLGLAGDDAEGAAADGPDEVDESYESVLDAILAEPEGGEGAAGEAEAVADEATPGGDFAALPDVSPELVAAFESLSEADITTFLTLDGEAAMAFLQSRLDGPPWGADAGAAPDEMVGVAGAEGEDFVVSGVAGAAAAEQSVPDAGQALAGLDPEILGVFLLELQELLEAWGLEQANLRRAPADAAALAELRRVAHTVKGAANMVGLAPLGRVGGQVEQLLDALLDRGLAAAPPILDFIERSYAALQRLSADATADQSGYEPEIDALAEAHAALMAELPTEPAAEAAEGRDEALAVEPPSPQPPQPAAIDTYELAGDDLADLVELFVQEAEEHLAGLGRALVALDRDPADGRQLAEAKRLVHTLKGAAAALGYPVTAGLCHSVEDLFAALEESGREPSRELRTLFFEASEALERLVAAIAAGRAEDAAPAERLRARFAAHLQGRPDAVVAPPVATGPATSALAELAGAPESARRTVRVDIAHLDALLNLVGELVINRTSQEQHLERLARSVNELRLSVERLRRVGYQLETRYEVAELMRVSPRDSARRGGPLGPLAPLDAVTFGRPLGDEEFDELELDRYTELHRISRELVEVAADVTAAQSELDLLYDGLEQGITQQGRVSTDLQDRLMEVRLVPVSNIASRLYRAIRQVANRRRREVDFVLEGEGTQIDKVLLEEITDPLLHLVRNAVDHGIEDAAERRARGKPATGTIRLSAGREGNEAVIRIADDGAGINLDAVLDKALARGLIRRRDELTREQALGLIFQPGFSTAAGVSDISGRGVGLDVVRTNVARLKGTIDVASTPGVGTTFTIRLPILLAVTRALLVRVGGQTYAIPLPVVEQVAFYRRELVRTVGGNELFDLGDRAYPLVWLAQELGLGAPGEQAGSRALIVGHADRQIALVVDELVGQQEVVVKRLGRQLQSVAGVAGATVLGNGQIVLILNVLDLLGGVGAPRRAGAPPAAKTPAPAPLALAERVDRGERVALVVDDSLSVRRVLTRTLERDGWTVLQAKDGVEALETLAWARPRIMLLDIEMPRMDGYELTGLVRGHPEHRELPILMLTSRAGEKHRRKALELGVSAYLVKPFDEAQLLATVRELAAGRSQEAARVS